MGADFMCAICEMPLEPESLREVITYRLDNMNDKKIENFASNWWHTIESTYEDQMDDQSLTESDIYKLDNIDGIRLRRLVTMILSDLLDEFVYEKGLRCRRDIADVLIKDTWYAISGGMSWGDLPTEAYEGVSMLDDSGLLDGLGANNLDQDKLSFKC